ncbi:MAG: hypothetical protein ACQETQ_09905 [Spirochaetota bacterium]
MANVNSKLPPAPGFIKVSSDSLPELSAQQRAALIRKGNELYNQGKLGEAQRVFLTARYGDGLVRLGEHYQKQKKPLEAFRMFWQAGDTARSEAMIEKMAGVVRHWLEESDEGQRDR